MLAAGDAAGLSAGLARIRWTVPSAAAMRNRPAPLVSNPPTKIHLPSGDHAAVPRTSIASAIGRTSDPSVAIRLRRRLLPCLSRMVAQRPSGDTAGGSRDGHSGALQ